MSVKTWQLNQPPSPEIIKQFPEINPIILQLLNNRGIDTQDKIDHFLTVDYGQDTYDPFLFNDMAKAVDRIFLALESGQKIVIYGDYDADGVTSTAVLSEYLKELGADIDVYIPYRETEGYGLNIAAAKKLVKDKIGLVITVDCGISNVEEVKLLQENGIDVIITDHHHEPLVLPQAFAILNPSVSGEKYPFKKLAGCGVAYKLVQALALRVSQHQDKPLEDGYEKWLLDLVAIGTIADLQPVLDENRVLVKYGLVVLQKTKRLGLLKLVEKMSSNLTILDQDIVGWRIAPRLNAAGRLGHASTSYELLITDNPDEAERLAEQLNKKNQERQQLTEKIHQECLNIVGQVTDQKILILIGHDWPTGIVGLVAGRLTDKFHLPSLVISHYNGEIIGSGRSIPEFNIVEAIAKCDRMLARYGGHAQACGFTVKDETNLKKFIVKMTALAKQELAEISLNPSLEIDVQISLTQVNWDLFDELEKFKPYGEGNPKPRFLAKGLTIHEIQGVGQDGKHLRLMVCHHDKTIHKTIGFGFGEWRQTLKPGDLIDLVFEIDVNEWNGNRELQLKIIDLKKHD
ncbi:MAG: single-stranded-DNA-specific exonuclease RecJ [Patescibacteria group bacterium]|jgi:single-stranded-DNA-specific exonuclease|nr:single-stranded-DNA-specific exonuclease RecJ [Patescibacteria group bacterium]